MSVLASSVEEHHISKERDMGSTKHKGLKFLRLDFIAHIGSTFPTRKENREGDIY
jgi:hypothetical protein